MSSVLVVATATVAWAHVVLTPKNAPADSYQKFVVTVPTEKNIPTTEVRVEVPTGFTVTGVQPVPGWQHEFEKDGGDITAITWSGGKIDPEEFQEFAFQARTPKDTGDYPWKAYQTYEDGSVVEWIGPPDAEEPASVVRVGSGGSQNSSEQTEEETREHGTQDETTQTTAGQLASTGGISPFVLYGSSGVGGALLLTVAFALLRRR
ncbi:MAG: YcnI family protein [Rubrobacter sp.]|nr:YcnI family protein [Rubrobacter sp.]